jgi:hypothetical protein
VFLEFSKRCEVFIDVVGDDELIVTTLCAYGSVRREFNHLNGFSSTVSALGSYLEIGIQYDKRPVQEPNHQLRAIRGESNCIATAVELGVSHLFSLLKIPDTEHTVTAPSVDL